MERNAFYCDAVVAEGLPTGDGVPTEAELFAALNCQPGFWVPKKKLQQDLIQLRDMGLFKEVDVRVVPLRKGSKSRRMRAVFKFTETFYPPVRTFQVVNGKCLPPDINERVLAAVRARHGNGPTGIAVLATMRNEIEQWWAERGFNFSQIKELQGVETGDVRVTVLEPRIRTVAVRFIDDQGQEVPEGGQTPVDLIRRVMTLRPGQYYSNHDGRLALQQAFTLQAFENAQILPENVPGSEDLVDVTVMLRERPLKTMEMDLEWGMAPWLAAAPWLPLPAVGVPGGSLTYEDRNFRHKGDHVHASVLASSFLHPTDDLSFRLSFRRPYVFGGTSEEDFVADAFNTRRLSSAYAGAPDSQIPPVWVERAGARVGLERTLTRHSRSSLAAVAQQVKTRDDANALIARASRPSARGVLLDNGPPTTLTGTGCDRSAHAQAAVLRDTTYTVNGGLVGSRDSLQVTQGLGLGSGIFNKYEVASTRFIKLTNPAPTSPLPPATIALAGKWGNCIGPLAAYDTHVLGGPHSCRGFSLGELGPSRQYVEATGEVRVPVPVLNTHAYAFADHARDLGATEELLGRPREYYSKLGRGTGLGAGLRLGVLRVELAKDCNAGKWAWYVQFGERL